MNVEVIGDIEDTEIIAIGRSIRELRQLKIVRQTTKSQFVICLKNKGYTASLELRKVYQVVPDDRAAHHNYIRVIDESGEDYLYPANYFASIELPQKLERAFSLNL